MRWLGTGLSLLLILILAVAAPLVSNRIDPLRAVTNRAATTAEGNPEEPLAPSVPTDAGPAANPTADHPAAGGSPLPAQDPNPPKWEAALRLEAAVTQAMADFESEYSVVVHDLKSGQSWNLNPERRYHPASTIKIPVTLYTLEQYRAGKIGWHDLIEYTPADFESPGGGAFETSPFGGLYPIENLVNRALIYSNNVAVNMLGRHFGWAAIEAWTATINGELFRVNGSPEVTALSELGWWLHLYHLSQEDPQNARLLLTPLEQVDYDGRITAGLPKGTPHLHKFGSYDGNYHDGGIVFAKNPYIIIVMTHGGDVWETDEAIAQVSAAVFQVLNP